MHLWPVRFHTHRLRHRPPPKPPCPHPLARRDVGPRPSIHLRIHRPLHPQPALRRAGGHPGSARFHQSRRPRGLRQPDRQRHPRNRHRLPRHQNHRLCPIWCHLRFLRPPHHHFLLRPHRHRLSLGHHEIRRARPFL